MAAPEEYELTVNDSKEVWWATTKEYDLEIYSLFDKYNGLQIWNNPSHVAVNEESMIFTEDIIDLISKELDN